MRSTASAKGRTALSGVVSSPASGRAVAQARATGAGATKFSAQLSSVIAAAGRMTPRGIISASARSIAIGSGSRLIVFPTVVVRPARPPGIAPVAASLSQDRYQDWLIAIARNSNLMLRGKMNATGSVTLNAGATTTTITDSRIGLFSHVTLEAATASAATARAAGLYIVCGAGNAVIHHPSVAATDQIFSYLVIG